MCDEIVFSGLRGYLIKGDIYYKWSNDLALLHKGQRIIIGQFNDVAFIKFRGQVHMIFNQDKNLYLRPLVNVRANKNRDDHIIIHDNEINTFMVNDQFIYCDFPRHTLIYKYTGGQIEQIKHIAYIDNSPIRMTNLLTCDNSYVVTSSSSGMVIWDAELTRPTLYNVDKFDGAHEVRFQNGGLLINHRYQVNIDCLNEVQN
jgi:hypothetical protein